MRRVLFVVLKVIGVVLVLPPLLLLGTCTYTAYSPHLRFDPLIVDLMDAPRHPERGWRTIDVTLTPRYLQLGQSRPVTTCPRPGWTRCIGKQESTSTH